MLNLAILLSGEGSNCQAIIDAIGQGRLHANISIAISDNPEANGIKRAQRAGIPTTVLANQNYNNHQDFESDLLQCLNNYPLDFIVLAGFMQILGNTIVEAFRGKIINIHPSLLPCYPGLNTHQRVLDAGEQWHGTTVHFVTEKLDAGPIIAQKRLQILSNDTAQSLKNRVQRLEHKLYPATLQLFAKQQILN